MSMKQKVGKQPITTLVEMRLLKIISEICPATTRQIQNDHNEGMVSTLTRLKIMMQKGTITGTKEHNQWVWNLPEE